MAWIALWVWNQALLHLPRIFPSEISSELNCKVNLIHANVSSSIFCSAQRLIKKTLLFSSHAFPIVPLSPLVPLQFLCKLIGPHVQKVTPYFKHTSLSHPPAPHGSPTLDCVFCSALPVLSCFCSWHLGLIPPSQQWDFCIIYTIATGKWRQGWSWEEANTGEFDGNPKEQHFQLNQPRLTKALESPLVPNIVQTAFSPCFWVDISIMEILMVTCTIVFQKPSLQHCISRLFCFTTIESSLDICKALVPGFPNSYQIHEHSKSLFKMVW
jgi:hypothetical protein